MLRGRKRELINRKPALRRNYYHAPVQHSANLLLGSGNEYFPGKAVYNQIIYTSLSFPLSKDTMAIRKMTFTNLNPSTLRQQGEISKNKGLSWTTEYDLEYRRKKG